MIRVSVDSLILSKNKIMGDVTLNEPPIIIWDDDKIMGRAFSLLLTDFGKDATLVYRPERPLPNGATVYVEIEE